VGRMLTPLAEVELSLFQFGLALHHLRVRRLGLDFCERSLLRSSLRSSQIRDRSASLSCACNKDCSSAAATASATRNDSPDFQV
jgi:hypothetical protein